MLRAGGVGEEWVGEDRDTGESLRLGDVVLANLWLLVLPEPDSCPACSLTPRS